MRVPGAPAVLMAVALLAGAADSNDLALRGAADASDRGDYVTALESYLQLLDASPSERLVHAIAADTGEVFRTTELTTNGGAPQFSPDGKLIVYEAGTGALRTTRLAVAEPGGLRTLATLEGYGASFAPDGRTLVYLRVPRAPDIEALQAAADAATGTTRALRSNELFELVGRTAAIVRRDLVSGRETPIDIGMVRKSSLLAGAEGSVVFVGWAAEGDADQIYTVAQGGAPKPLTSDRDDKMLVGVNATGTAVLFSTRGRRVEGTGTFSVLALPCGTVTSVAGTAPSFSGDGATLAYVVRDGNEHRLMSAPVTALDRATIVRRGPERLGEPALSHDGRTALFQMMPRDDWEIFSTSRQAPADTRITREVQHDVLPRFLTPERFLVMTGEPRHRRSYVYDWPSLDRTRLFHNNTVRTIAPEYAWVPDRGGTRVLVVADRDGDTVSPARGVYLVDLTARVTRDDLRTRLTANLAGERALRAKGAQMFTPIADEVRRVVDTASTGRIFEYQKALFDFDSKHISKPDNARAAQYLFDTYTSFGYQPQYQSLEAPNALGGRTANVLATLPGTTHPQVLYVVSSHYDSVDDGPGADDDSSGTAALLETARVLKQHPQAATIVFASFTAEESGLLGSRAYVRRALEDKLQIAAVVNNDMIGWANDHRLDATVRYSNPGLRDVQHAAAMQFTKLITYDALYYRNTDAAAFYEPFGDIVTGIGGYPILGNPHYHEPHDVLETINHHLVTEVAKTTVATVMLLASSPSRVKDLAVSELRQGTATVTWTPGPEKDVVGYVVAWGSPSNPEAQRTKVAKPLATIKGATPGTVVSVKAVNARGLEGWAWASVVIK